MNFKDTLHSVELILATGEVPLIVGESGIGKTALARELAIKNNWSLIVIDGNLLKEGEIGGLPTIETTMDTNENGKSIPKKITVYAIHHKLQEIDELLRKGHTVLLFIDEINRCEHTVQQELMNLILNREINGYQLDVGVRIVAAMNPSSKYGNDVDYQVVDMDAAQENRFVWLNMEPDYLQWLEWATDVGLEEKVIAFISTFPEYLHKKSNDSVKATPRSYERISKTYRIYKEQKDSIPRPIFLNVLKGNVGKMIAEEFLTFIEANHTSLLTYKDVFDMASLTDATKERIQQESHTRLYLSARNILKTLESNILLGKDNYNDKIDRLIDFLILYPIDLRVGIMKDLKQSYPTVYQFALENEAFVELYFESYTSIN